MFKKISALVLGLGILFSNSGVAQGESVQVDASNECSVVVEKLDSVMQAVEERKKEIQAIKQAPYAAIELELVSVNDDGMYWYDKTAEFEPTIYVDWGTAEHWGVDDYTQGEMVTGVFDETGWDLLAIQR